MQFKVASVLAFAATAAATYGANVSYTTEVVTHLTTYCPEATEISYNGQTYTVTEATTLTITDCPCTISKPVYVTSSVVCNTCSAAPTSYPAYSNTTVAVGTGSGPAPAPTYPASPAGPVGTGSPSAPIGSATPAPTPITNGASNAMALSGASLAGLLGLAAFIL